MVFQSIICYGRQQVNDTDGLYQGFTNIKNDTRTKVWWFHGETETTKYGITKDLESFKKQGIGGVVYYDQVHGEGKNAFKSFSKEWWDMLIFASCEAKRLGLTFEVNVSNGFVAGGPWITPQYGMQKLAVVDTLVDGDNNIPIRLPVPESYKGYYKDVAVMAIPYLEDMLGDSKLIHPIISCSDKDLDAKAFFEKDKYQRISYISGKHIYINMDFAKQFTARSITYNLGGRGISKSSSTNIPGPMSENFVGTGYRTLPDIGKLEVSDDGMNYKFVCNLKPIYKDHNGSRQKTISFPETKGRFYRVDIYGWKDSMNPADVLNIGNIILSAKASIDQWEEKSALYSEYIGDDNTPEYQSKEILCSDRIIDMTDSLNEGFLSWRAPKGKWLVLRFCQVPTGAKIKHERVGMSGLECNKLSAEAARIQYERYFQVIKDSICVHGGEIDGMVMDSHEGGPQNWTDDFEVAFKSVRGYNLRTFLPAMAGYVVDGVRVSNSVLYDVRRTISDLMIDRYYGTFQRLCKSNGITFTAQAIGNALCITGDQIEAKKIVDKPQGEFWTIHPDGNYDIKDCSSAAHLYGKSIASAEAFTDASYRCSLSYLKHLADYAYSFGINEFVVCASAYQPWADRIPGNTAGLRQYALNRSNTYWAYSNGFWNYQARCAYLMRQGKPKADLCIYLGDDVPVKILTYRLPEIPNGYDFDAFTTDALIHRMEVCNGYVNLPDSVNYKLMIMPKDGKMSYRALCKIQKLVKCGISIYGPRPVLSSGYGDIVRQRNFDHIVGEMWNGEIHTYGKGMVYTGIPLSSVLEMMNIKPDVDTHTDSGLYFAHRRTSNEDIYFIDNNNGTDFGGSVTFRTDMKNAEIWYPESGERQYVDEKDKFVSDGTSTILLNMKKWQSLCIVFSDGHRSATRPYDNLLSHVADVTGKWKISFDRKRNGPVPVYTKQLFDWTSSRSDSIRYYSGPAQYHLSFNYRKGIEKEKRYYLQFKGINTIGKVMLNGQVVGTVWCSPWRLDITEYLRKGKNILDVEVINSLMNRLIGDSKLPVDKRLTYCTSVIADPDDALEPSGLTETPEIIVGNHVGIYY